LAQASACRCLPAPRAGRQAWDGYARDRASRHPGVSLACFLELQLFTGSGVMVHKFSAEARARRRARALDRGFLRRRPIGQRFLQVQDSVAAAARPVIRSLELHARHDALVGQVHHNGREASLAAFQAGAINEDELRRSNGVHRAGGRAKHRVSVPETTPPTRDGSTGFDEVMHKLRQAVDNTAQMASTLASSFEESNAYSDVPAVIYDCVSQSTVDQLMQRVGLLEARLAATRLDSAGEIRRMDERITSLHVDVNENVSRRQVVPSDLRVMTDRVENMVEKAILATVPAVAEEIRTVALKCDHSIEALWVSVDELSKRVDPPSCSPVLQDIADDNCEVKMGDPFEMLKGMCGDEDCFWGGPYVLRPGWACFSLRRMLDLIREARAARLAVERVPHYAELRPRLFRLDYSRFDHIGAGEDTDGSESPLSSVVDLDEMAVMYDQMHEDFLREVGG